MTLTRAGYRCTLAEDGRTAADLIETTNFDMALLDIMLPGLDGYALLECLRPQGVPVIFITAKSAVKDRVQGLRLGADDYITKPFAAEELCCPDGDGFAPHRARRARAVRLRRGCWTRSTTPPAGTVSPVELRRLEYDLLELLMRNRGAALYRDVMYERVWGGIPDTESLRTVDTHIARLRKKPRLDGQDRDGVQDRVSVEEGRLKD